MKISIHFIFDALKLAVLALLTVPAAIVTILVGSLDPHGKKVYAIGRFWAWTVLKVSGVSLKVEGLSRINSRQQYIFIANHQSNIDIPVLLRSLHGFQLRWLAKRELLWVPLFGWALWAAKHIIVNRSNRRHAAQALRTAQKRIEAGISVVVFPEGTRSRTGALLPFRKGGFRLASQTNTPVVPVTINGTAAILPVGGWRITPGLVQVVVGEPIPMMNYNRESLRSLSEEVKQEIARHLPHQVNALGQTEAVKPHQPERHRSTRRLEPGLRLSVHGNS